MIEGENFPPNPLQFTQYPSLSLVPPATLKSLSAGLIKAHLSNQ